MEYFYSVIELNLLDQKKLNYSLNSEIESNKP